MLGDPVRPGAGELTEEQRMSPREPLEPGSPHERDQGRRRESGPAPARGLTRREVLLGGGGLALVGIAAAIGLEHSRLAGSVDHLAAHIHTASSSRATVSHWTRSGRPTRP